MRVQGVQTSIPHPAGGWRGCTQHQVFALLLRGDASLPGLCLSFPSHSSEVQKDQGGRRSEMFEFRGFAGISGILHKSGKSGHVEFVQSRARSGASVFMQRQGGPQMAPQTPTMAPKSSVLLLLQPARLLRVIEDLRSYSGPLGFGSVWSTGKTVPEDSGWSGRQIVFPADAKYIQKTFNDAVAKWKLKKIRI